MRKVSILIAALVLTFSAFAQPKTKTAPKKNFAELGSRPADHFMLQIGTNIWNGAADSVTSKMKGLNRSVNLYAMYDKQFKSNPKFSIAAGIGVGTSNIYFNRMEAKIGSFNSKLPFIRTDTGNNYKKYKVTTAYLEIPLEFRFMSNPSNPNKAIKAAIGLKLGTLLNAHTKGKTLQNSAGTKLNTIAVKETSKAYFNGTRIVATARVGYGIYSLFGAYNFTNVFKDGVTAPTKLIQIGFCISGL
jgi:Outer membrane protein beta-barrel domain